MAATHPTHPAERWAGKPANALPTVLAALRALARRVRRRFLAIAWELEAEGGYSLAARPPGDAAATGRRNPSGRSPG